MVREHAVPCSSVNRPAGFLYCHRRGASPPPVNSLKIHILFYRAYAWAAVQSFPHTFSTRIHHTFLRSKLPRTSIGANIDSRGWCSPFQAILHLGLHPPTPWGHAGGLVWVESSKQSRGTRLNCVFCSFRGPYSTHCKSCEKTSFWTNFFAL